MIVLMISCLGSFLIGSAIGYAYRNEADEKRIFTLLDQLKDQTQTLMKKSATIKTLTYVANQRMIEQENEELK